MKPITHLRRTVLTSACGCYCKPETLVAANPTCASCKAAEAFAPRTGPSYRASLMGHGDFTPDHAEMVPDRLSPEGMRRRGVRRG